MGYVSDFKYFRGYKVKIKQFHCIEVEHLNEIRFNLSIQCKGDDMVFVIVAS